WLQYTPSGYQLATLIQNDESLVLSAFDQRADAVILRPDPGEQLRVFENSGGGSTWTLSLQPSVDTFEYSRIAHLNVIVSYYAQSDENLERAIGLEQRKLLALGERVLAKTRGFSLGEMFPDAIYYLHNPPVGGPSDIWRVRTLELPVTADLFPPNE